MSVSRSVTLIYCLVLLAALFYAVGAMLVKRAADFGVGMWRTAFVANMISAVLNLPLLALGGTLHPELWWQPLVVAICFIGGQTFTFLALEKGDVSVATPVLGIKILLVAALVAVWGGEPLRWTVWAAAALATSGIVLLNRRPGGAAHRPVGVTIVTAGLAAASYATLDVLVQHWAPIWGMGRFLPITLGLSALLSFGYMPLFRAPLSALPRPAWRWLFGGTLIIGLQSATFVSLIAYWGHAASINVVYSSRGLWSVVLVWACGHWVSSREQQLGATVLGWRMAGALLMLGAIVLVLV